MATHIEDALEEYACGPGGHDFNSGIRIGRTQSIAAGQSLPDANIETCRRCLKLADPDDCLFCAEPAEMGCIVRGPDGRVVPGALCSLCYLDIYKAPIAGWTYAPSPGSGA